MVTMKFMYYFTFFKLLIDSPDFINGTVSMICGAVP